MSWHSVGLPNVLLNAAVVCSVFEKSSGVIQTRVGIQRLSRVTIR